MQLIKSCNNDSYKLVSWNSQQVELYCMKIYLTNISRSASFVISYKSQHKLTLPPSMTDILSVTFTALVSHHHVDCNCLYLANYSYENQTLHSNTSEKIILALSI